MSDLFSNLAALSLGSKVGMQPLVPPLFAPAPQLLYDATMQAFNDGLAETAENNVFSITPPMVANGTDIPLMEQPSDEVVKPAKRTTLSDLVPPGVAQSAINSNPHVNNTEDEAFRSSMYWLLRKADEASMPQPLQLQEATLPNTGNSEITSSSIIQEQQQYSSEKKFPAMPGYSELQRTTPKDHPVISRVDASHDQNLSVSSDKPKAPLPIQPALPVSIPLLPRDDLSEQSVNSDDIPDEQSSLSMQTHIQSSSIPVHMERFIAPDLDRSESVSHASKSKRQVTAAEQSETAFQQTSGLGEHTIKPVLGQNAVVKEREESQSPSTASTPEGIAQSAQSLLSVPTTSEMFQTISPVHLSDIQDALHSSRTDSKLEAHGEEAESEVSPIHITIGRVVVRATQAAPQPIPIKKRELRPAQSLDEYLKQRERGSR